MSIWALLTSATKALGGNNLAARSRNWAITSSLHKSTLLATNTSHTPIWSWYKPCKLKSGSTNWRGSTTVNTAPTVKAFDKGGVFNSSMTLAAWAKPLASMIKRSGRFSRNILVTVTVICGPATQHKQPPEISATGMLSSVKTAPSMPISPNSLTMMTHFSCSGFCANKDLMAVVLPVPKKPENKCTLVFTAA